MPWHWVSAVHLLKLEGGDQKRLKSPERDTGHSGQIFRMGELLVLTNGAMCVTYFIPAILMEYGI